MSLVAANRALSPRRSPRCVAPHPGGVGRERKALPEPMELALWRRSAEARLEVALADLDHQWVDRVNTAATQRQVVDAFILWTRRSVAPFASGLPRVNAGRSSQMRHWEQVADDALAGGEPEQLDRFLRIWLAVIHEATASGQASLYALPSD